MYRGYLGVTALAFFFSFYAWKVMVSRERREGGGRRTERKLAAGSFHRSCSFSSSFMSLSSAYLVAFLVSKITT